MPTKKSPKRLDELAEILNSEDDDRIISAAEFVIKNYVTNRGVADLTAETSPAYLIQFFQRGLLDRGQYEDAARLIWGKDIFTTEPESVQRIWKYLPTTAQMLVPGAASLGKSYSVAVWLLLDWLRDPEWTCIKVVSVTEEHAKRNVFAHIKNLHQSSRIPMPGVVKDASIQIGMDDKQGIHRLAIPQGDEGKGRLRGFHPVPRATPHAQFGVLSRVRAILDEAEEIPSGVWEDVDNMLATKDGVEHVKVIGATNPKDINSRFSQRCEPPGGWQDVNMEESLEWMSRLGWQVVRLDGARCENVHQRKVVFPGLLTWDGYAGFLKQGDMSPTYFTMGRGWWPVQGLHINVIPADFIGMARGTYLFTGATTYCAAVDLAFEGGDKAVMTIGRWGKAIAYYPDPKNPINFNKPQYALQVESQFELPKVHTLDMAKNIKATCDSLHIGPEWLIVDRTGNGTGTHDALKVMMPAQVNDMEVMGLNFGEASTSLKILQDDTQKADELYDGVVTELFFALRKFIEFHAIKLAPGIEDKIAILSTQLTNRRFKQVKKGRVRVESKKEYKARGNPSPDHADSLTLLVHLVRMRSEFTALMLANQPRRVIDQPKVGIVDQLNFINFNDDK